MTKKNAIIRRLPYIEYLVVKEMTCIRSCQAVRARTRFTLYLRRISFLIANIFYCCQILKPFSSSKALIISQFHRLGLIVCYDRDLLYGSYNAPMQML